MLDQITERPTTVIDVLTKTPPTGDLLFEAVALALEARGDQKTAGYEGIENRGASDVMAEPVSQTVFGWVAEELRDLGFDVPMQTVGQTLQALGVDHNTFGEDSGNWTDESAQHWAAHIIGCHCHGDEITASAAASRVRSLKSDN